jgi:hypothetical protein
MGKAQTLLVDIFGGDKKRLGFSRLAIKIIATVLALCTKGPCGILGR